MYVLHHFPLCPSSRLVRILLAEKQLHFKLVEERVWENSNDLRLISPAMELPVLAMDNHAISSIYAICEYLEAIDQEISFLSSSHFFNAEIRRLVDWFTKHFNNDVTKYLFEEKIVLNYTTGASPRTSLLRLAKNNLFYHLDYIEYLLHQRKWLAGNSLSLADFAAAAQISCIDYLGDMEWSKHPLTKEWYAIIKSRPSFRTLLNDRIIGFTPPPHYQNLDF